MKGNEFSEKATALEALNELKKEWIEDQNQRISLYHDNLFSIIETELKDYESRKHFLDNIDKDVLVFEPKEIWEDKLQKLKAFEIIKNKEVDISDLKSSNSVDFYNISKAKRKKLTKEEYNLLKEEL